MEMPQLLWTPDSKTKDESNLAHYLQWLKEHHGLSFKDYQDLWQWSTNDTESFWKTIWKYFDVISEGSYSAVCTGTMPKVKWFEGARLNYAEHIFRQANGKYPAIIFKSENTKTVEISWSELSSTVGSLQGFMKSLGVKAGDTVAGYLPCIPEASAALLASTSLGAIWSSCSPDFENGWQGKPAVKTS